MTQKYLYIVADWVPFPSSEYGGLYCIIAENADECFNIIVEGPSKYFMEKYNYKTLINAEINKAKVYPLLGEYTSGIVDSFTT